MGAIEGALLKFHFRSEIENDKIYEVALPSFLALGGDRYEMIPKQMKHHKNTGFLDKVSSFFSMPCHDLVTWVDPRGCK